nr:secretin N-terminal domain-containing protein [Hyphomonas sp. Mor2]
MADPEFATGEARAEILQDLIRLNEAEQAERTERGQAAIKSLILREGPTLESMRLSVNLDQADLSIVMAEILRAEAIDYFAPSIFFAGRVSARFKNRPLVPSINLLLDGTGIIAQAKNGVLNLSYGESVATPEESQTDPGSNQVSREIILRHLAAADVETMLDDLFDSDSDDEETKFTVSGVAELNTVYIAGPEAMVSQAMNIVARADRPVPHVIISAIVVKVNTSSVESLGIDFSDVADGSFSISSIIPNTTGGNIVATFEEMAGNTAQLTATIKFLAAQNIAQVLSRPYVATRSTMPATIEIVDDQFVRVDTTTDDSSIIATDSITAGISMTITPIVMADSSVRLDLSIEDSRFSATAGDILIAKERNTASTSMVVGSGKTIVIGGLSSRYRITEKSGVPWLRKIPLVNFFTAEQDSLESENEMVVYLTPYVWLPGIDLPTAIEGQNPLHYPSLLSVEKFGRD